MIGVRIDTPTGSPILLLKDTQSGYFLPLWIGSGEAAAITQALEGILPPRPLTHDLLAEVVRAGFADDVRVEITGLEAGTFTGVLHLGDQISVEARPSDLVALALRMGLTIACSDDVLAEAGVELLEPVQDEVEAFIDFLDHVNPDDFEN